MNDKTIHSYKELIVWQKSIELVVEVYLLTEKFPKEELYGLTSQMRRSSVSIPSNIAEGRMRGSKKDFVQFLRVAYSSGAELETQVIIAKRLPKTNKLDYMKVDSLLNEVMKMLHTMIKKLNPNEANEAIS
jgi:four helix bundle protein